MDHTDPFIDPSISTPEAAHASDARLPSPIVLQLPAEPEFIRLVRLMASGVATRLGLPVDGVQDVRIAVDEGCATLVEAARGGPMTIEFAVVDDSLVVSGHAASGEPIDEERLTVSRQILDVITDDYTVSNNNTTIRFRLVRGLEDLRRG